MLRFVFYVNLALFPQMHFRSCIHWCRTDKAKLQFDILVVQCVVLMTVLLALKGLSILDYLIVLIILYFVQHKNGLTNEMYSIYFVSLFRLRVHA